MKTGTKLIIALLTVVVLIVLSTVIVARVYIEGAKKDNLLPVIKKSKTFTTSEKLVEDFYILNANIPGKIFFIESDTSKVLVKTAKRSTLYNIRYKINNGVMNIDRMDTLSKNGSIEIYLFTDSLNQVKLRKGAQFETESLHVSTFICNISESTFKGVIHTSLLDISGNDSSVVTIEGSADELYVNIKNRSVFNLSGMKVNNANLVGSGNSQIHIHVKDTVAFELSGDCKLRFMGDPVFKNLTVNQSEFFERVQESHD